MTGTELFDIDSARVGSVFSVEVTLPAGYTADSSNRYRVVYATDAHTNRASTIAAAASLIGDRLRPVEPFVLVNIGYADNDFAGALIRRNREFVPPGESVPAVLERHVRAPAYAALLGADGHRQFMDRARHGRADNFLAFFEEELHPEIVRRFPVASGPAALFGHSFGGLFTLYALTSGTPLFDKFCAASPGLTTDDSVIFGRYRDLAASLPDPARDIDLFVTLCDLEITGPLELYRKLGVNTLRFIDQVSLNPLAGLRFGSSIITGETHFSTVFEAFRRFVRFAFACDS